MREPQLLPIPKVCVPLTAGRLGLVKVMQLFVQPGKELWPQSVYPSPFPFAKSLPEARTSPPPDPRPPLSMLLHPCEVGT